MRQADAGGDQQLDLPLGMGLRITPSRRLGFFIGLDVCLVVATVVVAALLRFEGRLPPGSLPTYLLNGLLAGGYFVAISFAVGTYRASWGFFGLRDIARVAVAVALGTFLTVGTILALRGAGITPTPSLAANLIQAPLTFCAVSAFRLAKRAARLLLRERTTPGGATLAIIVGAGPAGAGVLKSIQEGHSDAPRVAGFVDDDPLAWNTHIHGVRVLGPVAHLERHLRETGAKTIIIAMPSATSALVRDVVRTGRGVGAHKVRIVPTLAEIVGTSTPTTREVTMDDLLGRDPVHIDLEDVRRALAAKCVLVTGGAGTIGSELCRQIARLGPRELVILDVDETRIHDLALELKEALPELSVVQALVDIRDAEAVDDVFRRHGVDVVFHAAAYKHVPMMELWPLAALEVNVLGTRNVLDAAKRRGSERFVLISTDKAVEPSSIMGASKRLAEFTLFGAPDPHLKVAAVRFGNVLGSRGSVLPIFERQLKRGGPLTVTHPEIERYFMMTSEAGQLVLQASVMASACDVFVLDMGKPVRILDVAREFIRLHGLEPDQDVQIVFTGLRPGEKLAESLHYHEEGLSATSHPRIFKTTVRVAPASLAILQEVDALVARRDPTGARTFLERQFPTLNPRVAHVWPRR